MTRVGVWTAIYVVCTLLYTSLMVPLWVAGVRAVATSPAPSWIAVLLINVILTLGCVLLWVKLYQALFRG